VSEALEQAKPERPKYTKHNVRIEVGSRTFNSRVFLDGQEMRGVYSVRVDIDSTKLGNMPMVTILLAAGSLEITGDAVAVIQEEVKPRTARRDPVAVAAKEGPLLEVQE
jgi:hypothetical protein